MYSIVAVAYESWRSCAVFNSDIPHHLQGLRHITTQAGISTSITICKEISMNLYVCAHCCHPTAASLNLISNFPYIHFPPPSTLPPVQFNFFRLHYALSQNINTTHRSPQCPRSPFRFVQPRAASVQTRSSAVRDIDEAYASDCLEGGCGGGGGSG